MITPWVQTASGAAVELLWPKPETIFLTDISISLSRLPRFNGHTRVTWTVAAHSMLVAQLVRHQGGDRETILWALLHDAHEAYLGDIISPVAEALFGRHDFATDTQRLLRIKDDLDYAICEAFSLVDWLPDHALVRLADLQALRLEKERLMAPPPQPWGELPAAPDIPLLDLPNDAARIETFSNWVRNVCPPDAPALRHREVFA